MEKTRLEQWICEIEGLPELTREALEHLQLCKLNALLERVHQRNPQYPSGIDRLTDLRKLPFTTSEMLAQHPGRFLATSQSEIQRVISGATSGTTGPAKRVFYTAQDTAHTVGFFAAGISEMLTAGEKCLIAFPFTGPFGLGDLIAQAVEQLGGIPVKAGFGQTWRELAELVRREQPETYIGFPVTLLGLTRVYGETLPVRRALVSGDACPKGVMDALEQALGNRLYPHYGSRECGLGGAVTCPAFEGMHLRENHILAEIVDENGEPVPDGEYGELVITTIGMEAMPLIRYRTGDYTRFLPPCPCGGVTKRLDTVSRREGGPVSMEELDSLLFRLPELVDYEASWNEGLSIRGRITRDIKDRLHNIIYENFGIYANVCCELWSWEDRPMYFGKRHVVQAKQDTCI